jgi:hypothetical protein
LLHVVSLDVVAARRRTRLLSVLKLALSELVFSASAGFSHGLQDIWNKRRPLFGFPFSVPQICSRIAA